MNLIKCPQCNMPMEIIRDNMQKNKLFKCEECNMIFIAKNYKPFFIKLKVYITGLVSVLVITILKVYFKAGNLVASIAIGFAIGFLVNIIMPMIFINPYELELVEKK